MTAWLIELFIRSISVFAVTEILTSAHIESVAISVVVALVYTLLKMLFRGILVILSMPLMIVTLELFWFVINTSLLWVTDNLVEGSEIESFSGTIVAPISGIAHWYCLTLLDKKG